MNIPTRVEFILHFTNYKLNLVICKMNENEEELSRIYKRKKELRCMIRMINVHLDAIRVHSHILQLICK